MSVDLPLRERPARGIRPRAERRRARAPGCSPPVCCGSRSVPPLRRSWRRGDQRRGPAGRGACRGGGARPAPRRPAADRDPAGSERSRASRLAHGIARPLRVRGRLRARAERARRSAAPLSLIVGDLDRFRRIEDLYGRAAGDAALERVARAIDGVKRGFDSAARVGGEEYALLAPDCDEHGGYMLAERVRTEVDGAVAGPHGRLTISFGVATFPFHGQTAESLLRAADQALYAAKRLGRNRTVISSAEEPGLLAPSPRAGEEAGVGLAALIGIAEALDVRDFGSASHCHRVGRFAELTGASWGWRRTPSSACGWPASCTTSAGWECRTRCWRRPVRSPTGSGRGSAPTPRSARGCFARPSFATSAWILRHHERPDGGGYPEGVPPPTCRSKPASSPSRTPTTR